MSTKKDTSKEHKPKGSILKNRMKPKEVDSVSSVETVALPEEVHAIIEKPQLHASKKADNRLVTRSYTIYPGDDDFLDAMIPIVEDMTRAKITRSTIIRLAIKYMHTKSDGGSDKFKSDIAKLLNDCL